MTNDGHLWSFCGHIVYGCQKRGYVCIVYQFQHFLAKNGRFDHLWTLCGHDRMLFIYVARDSSIDTTHEKV